MSATSQDDEGRSEDQQLAAYMKHHFGMQLAESESAELDDDAKVDAYFRQHFAS